MGCGSVADSGRIAGRVYGPGRPIVARTRAMSIGRDDLAIILDLQAEPLLPVFQERLGIALDRWVFRGIEAEGRPSRCWQSLTRFFTFQGRC